ncbi:MAG: hypothetical protein HY268_26490 [Deltaproteobacteria bacterium]|nr:hypothetical protein [Deltaproteobacteria bacterium]
MADIFQEPQTHMWSQIEQCLYYQYRNHFDKVKPYLDRLFQEGLEETRDTWGRITARACLAGHVDREQLFTFLKIASGKVRQGVARVFSANLGQREYTATCHVGLLIILRYGDLTDDILRTIEGCFGRDSNFGLIQDELAFAYIDALSTAEELHNIYHFLEWLALRSRRDPLAALKLTESLADKLEQRNQSQGFWPTEPLIATLIEILREADETDDATMIQRAIQLQDRLLKMHLRDMETLLDRAARN